jgi:hypothetical protein
MHLSGRARAATLATESYLRADLGSKMWRLALMLGARFEAGGRREALFGVVEVFCHACERERGPGGWERGGCVDLAADGRVSSG